MGDQDITELHRTHRRYRECLGEALTCRDLTIEMLEAIEKGIEESYNKSRIARIVGSGSSLVGTGLGLFGLALAPFTAGGSLALTISGGMLGAAGGVTTAGSDIVYYLVSEERLKMAAEVCDIDWKKMKELAELGRRYEWLLSILSSRYMVTKETLYELIKQERIEEVYARVKELTTMGVSFLYSSSKLFDGIQDGMKAYNAFSKGSKVAKSARAAAVGARVADTALDGAKAAKSGASIARTGIKAIASTIDVVTVPMDIYALCKASYDVYQYQEKGKSNSDKAMTVREHIEALKKQREVLVRELRALE